MIWRFFRRRDQTTTEEEKQSEQQLSREGRSAHTPSMSAFSFRTPDSVRTQREDLAAQDMAENAGDTAVDVDVIVTPQADVASVVRTKTNSKVRPRVLDRGVRPVMVPNLSELAANWRVNALRMERDRPDEAIELWSAYLSLRPTDIESWFLLGETALGSKDMETASQAFLQVCQRDPDNGLAHGALGFIASEHGFYDEAISRYQKAVSLRDGCRDMLSELLRCQRLGGDESGAAMTGERLTQLDLDRE